MTLTLFSRSDALKMSFLIKNSCTLSVESIDGFRPNLVCYKIWIYRQIARLDFGDLDIIFKVTWDKKKIVCRPVITSERLELGVCKFSFENTALIVFKFHLI